MEEEERQAQHQRILDRADKELELVDKLTKLPPGVTEKATAFYSRGGGGQRAITYKYSGDGGD